MLSQISNCASFGACAMVCESPQPKASMSRLSRAASISPVIGVRFTRTVRAVSRAVFRPHASTTNGISAIGSAEPNRATPDAQA